MAKPRKGLDQAAEAAHRQESYEEASPPVHAEAKPRNLKAGRAGVDEAYSLHAKFAKFKKGEQK